MKKYKYLSLSVAVVVVLSLAIGVVAWSYSGTAKYVIEGDMHVTEMAGDGELGALVSPFVYTKLYLNGGVEVPGGELSVTNDLRAEGALVDGGSVTNASSSLTVADTLTAAEVCNSSVIEVTPGALAASSLDITLPATTTLFADCLDTAGDSVSFFFCNESATAASTTQIVAGTHMELVEPDGQNVEIGGGNCAKITLTRWAKSATLGVLGVVDEFIPAD